MKRPDNILFFVLVFLLQLVISDYVHPGPYLYWKDFKTSCKHILT